MTRHVLFATTVFTWLASAAASAQSPTSIRFDFETAEIPAELEPSGWLPLSGGTRTIEDGSYVIAAPSSGGSTSIVEFGAGNVIIESQIRFLDVQAQRVDNAVLVARDLIGDFGGAEGTAGLTGYSASVDSQGGLSLSRLTPGVGVDPIVQDAADGFDAVNQDLKLRLVLDGPTVELFAWPPTEAMPLSPQLVLNDPNPWLESDYVSLGNTTFDPAGVPGARVAFRYLDVTVVPEPTGAVLTLVGIVWLATRRRRTPPVRLAHSSIRPVVTQAVLHLGILFTLTSASWSQNYTFREDFDGSPFPGNVSFVPPPGLVAAGVDGLGTFESREGSYFIQPESGDHAWVRVTGVPARPIIEVRARMIDTPVGDTTFLSLSNANAFGDMGYYSGVFSTGIPAGGWSTNTSLDISQGSTPLVDTAEWFTMRLEVGDDRLELRAWNDGDAIPGNPQWTYPTSRFDETLMSTASFSYNLRGVTNRPVLELDYIQVTAVPEPSSGSLILMGLLALVRRKAS